MDSWIYVSHECHFLGHLIELEQPLELSSSYGLTVGLSYMLIYWKHCASIINNSSNERKWTLYSSIN